MDAARLRVAYRNASGQGLEILRIDADGGVQVRSPSETARGDYGIYDLNRRIITLLGSVSLNRGDTQVRGQRSEEHTSELQSLMRIPYAVFCLKTEKHTTHGLIIYHSIA